MKFLVLLAVVGLASCRVVYLHDDDDRRDVRIKYSIDDDDNDREVDFDDDYRPRAVSTFIQRPEPVHFFQLAAPKPQFKTQYVEVEAPRPAYTQVVPVRSAPRTKVVTQYISAQPALASLPRLTVPAPVVVPQPRSTFVTQRWNTFATSGDDSSHEDK